ncbi:MAG: ATP-binding protein, partial [Bacteroidota bacterium]
GDGTAFDIMQERPDIPLIFVTGGGDEELAVKAMRQGAYDYLIKDPDYQYLKLLPLTVENALNHHVSNKKLEESERRYRELIEGTSDLVQSFDQEGQFHYVNKAWKKVLGYTAEELGTLSFYDIIHSPYREETREHINQLVEGQDIASMQTVFVTKRGKRITVQGNATVSKSDGVVNIRAIFHDVSAQIEAEKALKRSNEELEQLVVERAGELARMNESLLKEIDMHKLTEQELKSINEELNTFIYKTSHDIRGPLTSIMGLVNVARLEEDTKVLQHYFRLVEDRMVHLDEILKELINVSKIKQGVLEHIPIDFKEIMQEVLDNLMHMPNFERVQITRQIEFLSGYRADPHIIRTILHNLTVNAIKYQRPEELNPRFSMVIRQEDEDIVIEACDNGIGIDDQVRERVFDMFYRGTKQSEGSGLGLYIVRNAVDKLKGSIALETSVGRGTSFTVRLPMDHQGIPAVQMEQTA